MGVLITGAGLIGSQIANLFVQKGDDVALYDIAPVPAAIGENVDVSKLKIVRGDILDLANLVATMKENHAHTVVHTAALLPGSLTKNLHSGIRVNLDGTLNVLEAARLTDAGRVVYTSTIGVYDRDAKVEALDEGAPLRPASLYGATKLTGEFLGTNYSRTYGLDFRFVRFANVFGPYSGPVLTNTGTFINGMLEAATSKEEVNIESIPPMVADAEWVFSKDAAQGAYLLATTTTAPPKGTPAFNIGTGTTTPAHEFAAYIKEFLPSVSIKLPPAQPQSRLPPMRIDKARKELGYEPKYDARSAVREMLNWYQARP